MEVIYDLEHLDKPLAGSLVTLGNFDGVHLGHQKIFKQLCQRSRQRQGPCVVMTFYPHPSRVLTPQNPVPLITTLAQRLELIAAFGIDLAVCLTFTREFSQVGAQQFVEEILWKHFKPQMVLVGSNFLFGKGRKGNPQSLARLGRDLGFEVEVVEPVYLGETMVSSSRVRQALKLGEVDQVQHMLGRPFELVGQVVGGRGLGKELGFPTANLECENELLPRDGIYACRALLDQQSFIAAVNIGTSPTVGDKGHTVEAFLIDYAGDLYGKSVHLWFYHRLRDEKKFANLEDLCSQIQKDVQRTRLLLGQGSQAPPSG